MKKIIAIIAVGILVATGLMLPIPAQRGNGNGANAIDYNGFHETLNILGKKSDWSGGGGYNNPDRSTIFVPQDTSTFTYTIETPDGPEIFDDIAIGFSQGSEMAVIDGNAFDDGWCKVQLPPGKYAVFICSRAKPGFSTEITGMVYVEDNAGGWYLYQVGSLTVTRKWKDAEDLFWVSTQEDPFGVIGSSTWIFDYITMLNGYTLGSGETLQDAMYFWDFDNNGNKLVKIRFYPM